MTAKVTYTEQQKQELIDLYQNQRVPVSRIVALGKFPGKATTIRKYLRSLGVPTLANKSSITNFETDIIEPWKQGESLNSLSKRFNTTKSFLSKQLKSLGYQVNNTQTQINFDDTVFDSIDTEEKAYWLGFIWADGNIKTTYKTCYRLTINLKLEDLEHLEKFNEFTKHTKYNIKIDKIKNVCSWYACSKHLWETLNNYGCTPKKSLTLKFPDESIFKSKDLIRHFIRGYFDGDGCISYERYKNGIVMRCSLLGTMDFVDGIKQYTKLENILVQLRHSKNDYFNLKLTNNESKYFASLIYDNAVIYLNRKYLRYQLFKKNNYCIPYTSKDIIAFGIENA